MASFVTWHGGPRKRGPPIAAAAGIAAVLGIAAIAAIAAATGIDGPYTPSRDDEVIATLPPGVHHVDGSLGAQVRARLDVALPLAKFYIEQSRGSGDLRYLGYAEASLQPWLRQPSPPPSVLVLAATIRQSRHEFPAALTLLDRALAARPDDAQSWLTRATIERVQGHYTAARASCDHVRTADAVVAAICDSSVRSLQGELAAAATALAAVPDAGLTADAQAWRWSELGDMAIRKGDAGLGERAYREALTRLPSDAYSRVALADLLLSQHRPREVLSLLANDESIEPMRLRIALAEQNIADPRLEESRRVLEEAFRVEALRGEAVHRREQARFLLDLQRQPQAALDAALENWKVQREPADVLILLKTATAAGHPAAADPARDFVREHHLEDVRLAPYLGAPT